MPRSKTDQSKFRKGREATQEADVQHGQPSAQVPAQEEDGLYETLVDLKKLLDEGIIIQKEFDKAKAKALGL